MLVLLSRTPFIWSMYGLIGDTDGVNHCTYPYSGSIWIWFSGPLPTLNNARLLWKWTLHHQEQQNHHHSQLYCRRGRGRPQLTEMAMRLYRDDDGGRVGPNETETSHESTRIRHLGARLGRRKVRRMNGDYGDQSYNIYRVGTYCSGDPTSGRWSLWWIFCCLRRNTEVTPVGQIAGCIRAPQCIPNCYENAASVVIQLEYRSAQCPGDG